MIKYTTYDVSWYGYLNLETCHFIFCGILLIVFVDEHLCDSLTLGSTESLKHLLLILIKRNIYCVKECVSVSVVCVCERGRETERKGNGGTCKDQEILVLGLQACTTMPSVYWTQGFLHARQNSPVVIWMKMTFMGS